MKTKQYSNGKYHFRTYNKTAGEGYEVGFYYGSTPIFVGNFIHAKEANQWYSIMNREIKYFSKKYPVGTSFPLSWYTHFAKNHLYKCYYGFLDRLFTRYNRNYTSAFKKDEKKYHRMKKAWGERRQFFKAA